MLVKYEKEPKSQQKENFGRLAEVKEEWTSNLRICCLYICFNTLNQCSGFQRKCIGPQLTRHERAQHH